MSDVSRKVVPDKGSLNRERPVTKVIQFPSCSRKLNWNGVFETECIQRDRMTGMVAGYSKQRKTKVAILKIILYLTGSQWSDLSSGITCS